MISGWIDTHAHIADAEFDDDRPEVLKRALENGITRIISVGTDRASSERAWKLSRENDSIYAIVGVHPHEADSFEETDRDLFARWSADKKICALGEMGLDYHYLNSGKETQKKVFIQQLQWAVEWKKKVVVHTRDAEDDTLSILDQFLKFLPGVLVHCFTGSEGFLDQCLERGFQVSYAGIITFKKSESLRQCLKKTPLLRLHIETDAPYLAPHPLRGKRNEPSFITHTLGKASEIIGIPLPDLRDALTANALSFFGITV